MLTQEDIHDAFTELAGMASREGKVIEIAVYRGSALLLASNFRIATQDVDAVAVADQTLINRFATEIAATRGGPADWLNDGVRTYLSPNVDGLAQHHELFRSYPDDASPGLRVFVPAPGYLLAMKLMAMRIDTTTGQKDLPDILNLIDVVGVTQKNELMKFAQSFYPEARVSPQVILGIEALWRERAGRQKPSVQQPQDPDEPPRYLGRSGSTPQ